MNEMFTKNQNRALGCPQTKKHEVILIEIQVVPNKLHINIAFSHVYGQQDDS